jgi:hypothetical protein
LAGTERQSDGFELWEQNVSILRVEEDVGRLSYTLLRTHKSTRRYNPEDERGRQKILAAAGAQSPVLHRVPTHSLSVCGGAQGRPSDQCARILTPHRLDSSQQPLLHLVTF